MARNLQTAELPESNTALELKWLKEGYNYRSLSSFLICVNQVDTISELSNIKYSNVRGICFEFLSYLNTVSTSGSSGDMRYIPFPCNTLYDVLFLSSGLQNETSPVWEAAWWGGHRAAEGERAYWGSGFRPAACHRADHWTNSVREIDKVRLLLYTIIIYS